MRWLSDEAVARLRQTADRPDLSGTRYTIREEIGRGGMGTVYLADDAVLDRPVALKVLDGEPAQPEDLDLLLREARVMAGLEHPGLVPIHDAGVLPDGRVFYAMKRVEGSRLDEFAATAPTLSDRLAVFRKICETVAFAHARGVVHRDLKPGNIMIGPFGEVLVLDWGVARRSEDPAEPGGTILGTRAYMAPEQAEGRNDRVDARADVYSLGVLLEELLGEDRERALAAVAARARSPRPKDRYARVEELSSDVGRFLDGQAPLAYRETVFERARRFFRRHRTAILLIAAYLVMRAAILLFYGR